MKKRTFNILVLVVTVITIAFLLALFITEKSDVSIFQDKEPSTYSAELNLSEKTVKDKNAKQGIIRTFTYKIQDAEKEKNLMFYVVHSNTKVYIDNKLVYSRQAKDNAKLSASPGCYWAKIGFSPSDTGKQVLIQVEPVYKNMINRTINFFEGEQYEIFHITLQKELVPMVLGFTLMLLGIIYFVVSVYYKLENRNASNFVYLGTLALLVGIWKVFDTQFMAWFLDSNARYLSLLSNIVILLIPIAFQLHIISNHEKKDRYYKFLVASATANMIIAVIAFAIDLLKILDIRPFTDYYMFYMVVAIAVILVCEIIRLSRENVNLDNVFITSSVIILLVCSLADIVVFFDKNRTHSPNYIMVGTLIYVSVYALITLKDMHDTYSRDRATGVFNRNKCNEVIRFRKDAKSTIIVFDVNNLKYINDTFGHEAGDTVLKAFAGIMRSCIPAGNFLGRSGGDEFIAIIHNNDVNRIGHIIEDIYCQIDEYNRTNNKEYKLSVASGYALSTETENKTYREMLRLADKRMYENKRAMKERIKYR